MYLERERFMLVVLNTNVTNVSHHINAFDDKKVIKCSSTHFPRKWISCISPKTAGSGPGSGLMNEPPRKTRPLHHASNFDPSGRRSPSPCLFRTHISAPARLGTGHVLKIQRGETHQQLVWEEGYEVETNCIFLKVLV